MYAIWMGEDVLSSCGSLRKTSLVFQFLCCTTSPRLVRSASFSTSISSEKDVVTILEGGEDLTFAGKSSE